MFEVEIKVKRVEDEFAYYEIIPVGTLNDKYSFCQTSTLENEASLLILAKQVLNEAHVNAVVN